MKMYRATVSALYRLALVPVLLLCAPQAAHAQFSVQPVVLRLMPEDTAHVTTLQVRNEGQTQLDFRFYVADFEQSETGDHRFGQPGEHPRSCAGRLQIFPDGAALLPGERQEIQVQLQPGNESCWSIIFAETTVPSARQMRIGQRIGAKVYGIPPNVPPAAEMFSVTAEPEEEALAVTIGFRNTGETPLSPEGRVEIRTMAGNLVETVQIQQFGALPGRERLVTVRAGLPEESGPYLAVAIIDFGGDHLIGGQAIFRIN